MENRQQNIDRLQRLSCVYNNIRHPVISNPHWHIVNNQYAQTNNNVYELWALNIGSGLDDASVYSYNGVPECTVHSWAGRRSSNGVYIAHTMLVDECYISKTSTQNICKQKN